MLSAGHGTFLPGPCGPARIRGSRSPRGFKLGDAAEVVQTTSKNDRKTDTRPRSRQLSASALPRSETLVVRPSPHTEPE